MEGTACPCCCRHLQSRLSSGRVQPVPAAAGTTELPPLPRSLSGPAQGPQTVVYFPIPRGAMGSWPNCTTGGNTVHFTVCVSDHMAAHLAPTLPYSKAPLTPHLHLM